MNLKQSASAAAGLLVLGLGGLAAPDQAAPDWRLELLRDEGIDSSKAALEKALQDDKPVPNQLQNAYERLGSEEFADREAAQKELLRGGEATAQWLGQLKRSPDPEVRRRVTEILRTLGTNTESSRKAAVQHAIRSLLAEGDERRADTGGRFYEWFGEAAPKLGESYRQFRFENTAERPGSIAKGRLSFPGDGGLDGDQRLVLLSKNWPGRDEFGEEFQVSAKLGGEDDGAGAWHLGIALGNIRALYHPGLNGGTFRFEEEDSNKYLSDNSNVGFNPSSEHLQWMRVKARRLPGGKVRLDVTLKSGGKEAKRFDRSFTVTAEQIGKLDRISLARSGRTGGTAHFEDLSVRIIRAK